MPVVPPIPSPDHSTDPRLWRWLLVSIALHLLVVTGWPRAVDGTLTAVQSPTLQVEVRITAPPPAVAIAPLPTPAAPAPPVASAEPSRPPPSIPTTQPTPKPTPKPRTVKPTPKPRPAKPVQTTARPPATQSFVAAAPAAAPPSTVPMIAAASPGPAANAERASLASLLRQAIETHKAYPYIARRRGQQGTATVAFTLTPTGSVNALALTQSSGHAPLDRAALAAVQDIAPFPPAADYLDSPKQFRLDIAFRLSQR